MISYWLTLLVVSVLPLFLGGVKPWASAGFSVLMAGLAIVWLVEQTLRREPLLPLVSRYRVPLLALALVALWALAQAAPLPAPLRALAHPLWHDLEVVLGPSPYAAISIEPFATRTAVLGWIGYFFVFSIVVFQARSRRIADRSMIVLSVVFIAYSAYGLYAYFVTPGQVFWLRNTAYPTSLTSTFINKNNFASFSVVGLLCTTFVVFMQHRHTFVDVRSGRDVVRTLSRFLELRSAFFLVGWLLCFTSLVLAHSRAAFLTAIVALMLFVWLQRRRERGGGGETRPVIAVLVAALIGLIALSGDVTVAGIGRLVPDAEGRIEVYRLAATATADRPILGSGLGTFEDVFRVYRSEVFPIRFEKLHSTWFELVLELGVPASLMFVGAMALLLRICWQAVGDRGVPYGYAALGVAVSVHMALHGLVDFPMQIPGVAAIFWCVLGVVSGQCVRRTRASYSAAPESPVK